MAIDFHKWKAEPSGMHSRAEYGNEEIRELLDSLKVQEFPFPQGAGYEISIWYF